MTKAKYSVLRKALDLKPEKDEQNTQAALTHYLQSGEEEYLKLVSDDGLDQYNTKLVD